MRRSMVPAVALAILYSALPFTAAAETPERNAEQCSATEGQIYTPPAEITGAPGDVLACTPTELPGIPGEIPKKSWKVQYQSKNAKGEDVAVSAIVVVPQAPWQGAGPRPVVAFNHGTVGLGLRCAYSKQLSGTYEDAYEKEQPAALLRAGYAVVATDGVGFLDGQTPNYMVGRTAGQALLDSARAAAKVPGAGLSAEAPRALWGYSEGGQAALWAAQLAGSYAPELKIVGTAAGGVPGDLRMIAHKLNGGQFAGFAAASLVGYRSGYPEMPFDELLNDNGRAAVDKLRKSCLIDTVFGFAGEKVKDYTEDHLGMDQIFGLTGPDGTTWGEIADSHKVGVRIGEPGSGAEHEIGFPTMPYRGENEQIIPIRTEEDTRAAYCAATIPTQWKVYPGDDHLTAAGSAIPDVVAWFTDRFGGKPAPDNCA